MRIFISSVEIYTPPKSSFKASVSGKCMIIISTLIRQRYWCESKLYVWFFRSRRENGKCRLVSNIAQVSQTMWNEVTTVIRARTSCLFCSNISRQPRVQFRRGRGGTPDLWSAIEILDKSSHIHHSHTHQVTLGEAGLTEVKYVKKKHFVDRCWHHLTWWTFQSPQVHLR